MECKVCGGEMGLSFKYGNAYNTPIEEEHICYKCGTTHYYNQSIGECWDYDKTDAEYLEGFNTKEEE
ncbi:MAG: hypothetical protein ACRCXT_24135 [Paraclostridium sp.]